MVLKATSKESYVMNSTKISYSIRTQEYLERTQNLELINKWLELKRLEEEVKTVRKYT